MEKMSTKINRKRSNLRCLNFVPLKSLEKEGLEAKLVGIKRIQTYISYEYPIQHEDRLVKFAARGTNARGYRTYWRNINYYHDILSDPPFTSTHGTFIVKLYELKRK